MINPDLTAIKGIFYYIIGVFSHKVVQSFQAGRPVFSSPAHGALAVTDRKKMHASTGRFEVAGVLDI